jgi:hypothetical protein
MSVSHPLAMAASQLPREGEQRSVHTPAVHATAVAEGALAGHTAPQRPHAALVFRFVSQPLS